MVVYFYYTTEEQEAALQEKYESDVKRKQAELNEKQRRTGVIQKYTGRAYVHQPVRVFHVRGEVVYFGSVLDKNKMSTCAESGGGIYALDADFKCQIDAFLKDVTSYSVTFSPSGKYGPTLDYCGHRYEVPAVISTETGDSLLVQDEDKYDIGVL